MDFQSICREFISPSNEYRGKPFWSWNGELRKDEVLRQTRVMGEMGLGGYFMHSRSGLITEYLGDEWFELINAAADEAEKTGMEAWLYDEDRWPSGSAGGKVTVDPQYRMKSLRLTELPAEKYAPDTENETAAVFAGLVDGINLWEYRKLDDVSAESVREAVNTLNNAPAARKGEWKALVFTVVPDPCDSNYNGTTYIDTMSRAAVERFIELTHEEYARRCGDRIGRSIKGIFTDEPHRGHLFDDLKRDGDTMTCSVCYTPDVFEQFGARYGYDALAILPELFYRFEGKRIAKVKLNYIDLCDKLFCERFARPIHDWCIRHNMKFTGHVLHEDSLMNQTVPQGSLMRFYEYMDYPGVDVLSEGNRCYWIVKQLSSACRQLGRTRLLSELYGCTGWQMNFKSHKAVGDWQALFGINLRCPHLSWYTMEGESKRDYPASILHQSPWYREYSYVEDYFARFGLVMSEGAPLCDVLVLNPIESVWCQAYAGWSNWIFNASPDIAPIEKRYAELFHMLTDRQIDFDYGEEEMMCRMARVEKTPDGALLRVGKAAYRVVVVSDMLTIRPSTLRLLNEFYAAGGKIIFTGEIPEYVDAEASKEPAELAEKCVRTEFAGDALAKAVRELSRCRVSVSGAPEGSVFAQARECFGGNGYACAVLNTDRDAAKRGLTLTVAAPGGYSVQEWNLETGERFDAGAVSRYEDGAYLIDFSLEAAGTRCFVLTYAENLPEAASARALKTALLTGDFDYITDEENVCVLDYVKLKLDDNPWQDKAEVLKADMKLRDSLGLEHRGGSMLQPWFSKLNDTRVYGHVEAEYEFFAEEVPQGPVYLAAERPENISYRLNGVPLKARDTNDFWIDDCFKKLDIPSGLIHKGRNTVTCETEFKRTSNTEAVYLVGRFGVKLKGNSCVLCGLPEKLSCGSYDKANMPFFTGSMTYRVKPEQYLPLVGPEPAEGSRVMLSPEEFTGGCVKVSACGRTTVLGWAPYEADVTEAVKARANIEVTVVGTRRNLFGPLHQIPKIADAYGPGNFVTEGAEWTDEYSLIDSGLTGIRFTVKSV